MRIGFEPSCVICDRRIQHCGCWRTVAQHGELPAMKSILSPKFRYYSSADTDLRRTFARVRREQRAEAVRQQAAESAFPVTPIFSRQRPK